MSSVIQVEVSNDLEQWLSRNSLPDAVLNYWQFNPWLHSRIPSLDTAGGHALIRLQFLLKVHRHAKQFMDWGEEFLGLWRLTPADSQSPMGLAVALWNLLPHVRTEFRLPESGESDRLLGWYSTFGAREFLPEALDFQVQTPNPNPASEFLVRVIGIASGVRGITEDVRTLSSHLRSGGLNVSVLDAHSVSAETFARDVGAIDIFCLPVPELMNLYFRLGKLMTAAPRRIGYIPWELPNWPANLSMPLSLLNEFWASTDFIKMAFRDVFQGPIHLVPLKFEVEQGQMSRAEIGVDDKAFVFLSSFDPWSYIERKNPIAVVDAFIQAFPASLGEPVILVVKTFWERLDEQQRSLLLQRSIQDRRIVLLDRNLSSAERWGLFEVCDAFVSLHRAEGFGRQMLEAMLKDCAVIATNYSGNHDFCREENSYPVDYELTAVGKDYPFGDGQHWANPSVSHASTRMREVFELAEGREARIRRAKSDSQKYLVGERNGLGDSLSIIMSSQS